MIESSKSFAFYRFSVFNTLNFKANTPSTPKIAKFYIGVSLREAVWKGRCWRTSARLFNSNNNLSNNFHEWSENRTVTTSKVDEIM